MKTVEQFFDMVLSSLLYKGDLPPELRDKPNLRFIWGDVALGDSRRISKNLGSVAMSEDVSETGKTPYTA